MDKDLELAIENPQEFLSKPQKNREWDMSIEDIVRSINYNPYESLATKAMKEPVKYNWVNSILRGAGSALESIGIQSSQSTFDMLGVYDSPNMNKEQADRLTEDVIFAQNFAYKARQAEDMPYASSHPELYDFSQGVGSFIGYALSEAIDPAFGTYTMFSSSRGQMQQQLADKYIEETGGVEGYAERKSKDDALSTGYAALNTAIERGLGMEKIVGRAIRNPAKFPKIDYFKAARGELSKQALKKTAEQVGKGFAQEFVEEGEQSYAEDATQILAGYGAWEDLLSKESFNKALKSAFYGGILGGAAGGIMFNVSRARVKRIIADWANEHNIKLTDLQATQATDTVINGGQTNVLNEITTRGELKSKNGPAFDILVEKVKKQIEGTGRSLPEGQDLDSFARTVARTIQIPATNLSLWTDIPIEDYLNAAEIRVVGGMWELAPISSSQDVKALLNKQKAIIKEQNKLKKLGTENESVLNGAKRRKDELQAIYDSLVQQESFDSVKTFGKKQQADYIQAQDLLPEQTRIIDNVQEATDDESFVLFAGKKVPVSYEIVELDSIQPSHINGIANPNFTTKELQNRASRGTTVDLADLRNKAQNFTPERVLDAPTSAEGAPITNDKMEVIAGNGRAEIIRFVYEENPNGAKAYKKALQKKGFDISGFNRPVLIRRNKTMSVEEQIAAADISNISETSAFDEASQAKQDSKYLKGSVSITDFANKIPMSERRGLMQNNGKWNNRLLRRRYEDALLSWLCGNDTKLFENLVLDSVLPQKIIEPLVENGSSIVDLQEKYPEINIREDIYRALVKFQRTNKNNFINVMQEQELDGRDVMPENVMLWNFIFANNTTIKMFLDNYTKTAMANRDAVNSGKDMFGETVAPLSKKDLYAQALKKTDEMRKQIADENNKPYESLFTETEEITDINLQSAFISYQNQFNVLGNETTLNQEQFDLAEENARLDDIYPSYDGETINIDGKERSVYNSNGERIAKSEQALRNFYKWFGDSKVVDEQGRPLVVYHGTNAEFDTFEKDRIGDFGKGYYFTTSRENAEQYAARKGGDIVMPVYLSIKNVYESPANAGQFLYNLRDKKTSAKQAQGVLLEQGFDGIEIKQFSGKEKYFVAFEPTQIKSVENRGTFSSDTGNIYWQSEKEEEKNLVVSHGISLNSLEKSLDLGGFPMPSIAITKATEPLADFGSISLIGTKNMIDPSNPANKVYDRDIWSITFPTKTYKNAKRADISKFNDKFRDAFEKADDVSRLDGSVLYYARQSSRPEEAVDSFVYSDGAKLYYIENVLGEKVDVPTYDKAKKILDNSMIFVKADEKFIEEISKIDLNKIDRTDDLDAVIMQPIQDLLDRFDFSEYGDKAKVYEEHARQYYSGNKFNFNDKYHLVESIKEYVRSKGKYEVNKLELSKMLDEKIKDSADYERWATKQVEDLLGEPKVAVGKKLEDWTLENIAKSMIKNAGVNAQKSLVYGSGKVIASGAKKLSSIQEIKEIGKNLKSKEEASQDIEKIQDAMDNYTSQFMTANDITYSLNQKEEAYMALGRAAGKKPTKESIQSALNYEFGNKTVYDDKVLEEGVEIIKAVQKLSRHYFEAKPQRIVRIEEFVGAVVPTDSKFDNVSKRLEEKGLKVERTDDLRQGIQNVESSVGNVLFQGSKTPNAWYDPDLQIIALTKKWNNLSLVHEMHHHYLTKILNIYNQAQSGVISLPEGALSEIKKLFEMLDISNPMEITNEQLKVAQERFAAMTEAYLTGLGVQENQNMVYKDFLSWIPEKYKSILNIGYLNEKNEIVNPLLDKQAIDFFNKWFGEPQMPSLATSPNSQSMINPTDDKGVIIPSSQKEMNDREIKFGIDSAEQLEADKKLYMSIDENTPSNLRSAIDGAKVELDNQKPLDTISMPETKRERWFKPRVKDAQERMAEMARDYVSKNPIHAKELALADPEITTVYDAPVDRAWLIRAVMENTDKNSEEYAIMYDNLATYRSMSGSTLGLTNDISQKAYLEAKREIEDSRELKAAINYAGSNRGAWDKWSGDIKSFINARVGKILATEAGTEERKIALKSFLEEAKTKFSGNTEDNILNQLDLTGVNARNKAVFVKWAEKAIKQTAGVGLTSKQQKNLMDASLKAQNAMLAIDDTDSAKSSAAAKDIRNWQILKDELKKANFGRFDAFNNSVNNLMGGYVPSAMLMSFNTLFVANIPSTAINNAIVKSSAQAIYGKQLVSKSVLNAEENRIRAIYNSSGMNLAQMEKPTSPSLLHGEKYMGQDKSHWYDFTFKVLSWGDNLFRIPTFIDTLGRIASKNAKGDTRLAEQKFREYCQLNTNNEEAKLARKEALAVSNMAVFTQDGILSTGLNHIRSELNKISRGLVGLDKEGFGLGNLLSPFLKTGANVVEMGISGSIAPIRTIAYGLKALNGKEIPNIQKIALRNDWKVFAFTAIGMALLSALTSDDDEFYIEPYELGQRYDPEKPYDSINIAGVWVKVDTFGVFSTPIRVAAKLIKEKDVFKAYGFGLQEAMGEAPLLNQLTSDPTYAFKQPGKWLQGFAYTNINKFIPSQLKSISKAGSRELDLKYDAEFLGDYLQRRFHRNYGFDGTTPTINDYINLFTNRVKYTD